MVIPMPNSVMTIFAEANIDVDLRMLRSFRVLRPLKLVSRIPSKTSQLIYLMSEQSIGQITSFIRLFQ